jgi:hypothetical protein
MRRMDCVLPVSAWLEGLIRWVFFLYHSDRLSGSVRYSDNVVGGKAFLRWQIFSYHGRSLSVLSF